jgi:hypothetical protein
MKGFYRLLASLLVVTVLAGCATAYQQRGFTGGYSETKVDDNHYIVLFDGNGKTSKDRVWYFWVYRCAQLTQEKGYAYFTLSTVQSSMNHTAFDPDNGGHAYAAVLIGDANGHVIDVHGGGGGGFVYVPGGGGMITSWHSKAVVTMYTPIGVPQKTFVIRAQSVMDALADYIRSNGTSTPPDRMALADASTFAIAPDNTIVNVHQYVLAHVHPSTTPSPYAQATAPTSSSPAAVAATPAATPAATSGTALGAVTSALNERPALAQSVANGLGCGAVQPNGNGTFVAPCGSYSVVIGCDGDQCRPMHTINAKSDD